MKNLNLKTLNEMIVFQVILNLPNSSFLEIYLRLLNWSIRRNCVGWKSMLEIGSFPALSRNGLISHERAYFSANRHGWDFMTVRQRIRIMRKWLFYVTDLLKIIEMSLTLNSNNYFQSIINSSHSIYLNPFVPTQNEPTHGLELQIYLPWLVIWSHIHCF